MAEEQSIFNQKKQELMKRNHLALRLNIFFIVTFLLFSILIVRLAVLQFVEGQLLLGQQGTVNFESYEFPPIRGTIYDRNGFAIADTASAQNLYFKVEWNLSNQEIVDIALRLSEVFTQYGDEEVSPEEVLKRMDVDLDLEGNRLHLRDPAYYYLPRKIKEDINHQEIAYIMEHRDQFRGLEIVEESIRYYTKYQDDFISPQLVGYLRPYRGILNNENQQSYLRYYLDPDRELEGYVLDEYVGFDGIEFMFQQQLRGINGKRSYSVNALGKVVEEVETIPPTKGNNLYLTIDKDVQTRAQQAIADHIAFLKSEEARRTRAHEGSEAVAGYAVAMEVKTGNVIAMANWPNYDPNIWHGGISPQDYHRIETLFPNGTIRERAPDLPVEQQKFHPGSMVYLGSTVKPLTVLLGLQEGLMTANESYYDRGYYEFGRDGSRIRNSDGRAWGPLNASSAIIRSSNAYMADLIGNRLFRNKQDPLDLWHTYMTAFGLGVSTESGLPGESRGVIDYYRGVESTGSAQAPLVFASFGQQGRYTTLQLAQYAATLANRGKRLKPQFVEKITTFDGTIVQTFEPEVLSEIEIDDRHWDVVLKAMEGVIKFDGFPYTVASKTGTSQQDVAGGKKVNNTVFIAYAPAEDPVLAVAVVVPEGGFGSLGAAPIARQIFDAYDEYIGLTGTPKPKAVEESDDPELEQANGAPRQESASGAGGDAAGNGGTNNSPSDANNNGADGGTGNDTGAGAGNNAGGGTGNGAGPGNNGDITGAGNGNSTGSGADANTGGGIGTESGENTGGGTGTDAGSNTGGGAGNGAGNGAGANTGGGNGTEAQQLGASSPPVQPVEQPPASPTEPAVRQPEEDV